MSCKPLPLHVPPAQAVLLARWLQPVRFWRLPTHGLLGRGYYLLMAEACSSSLAMSYTPLQKRRPIQVCIHAVGFTHVLLAVAQVFSYLTFSWPHGMVVLSERQP